MPMSKLEELEQVRRDKWAELSGSDQFAVEKATFRLECDGRLIENLTDDELRDYAYEGCRDANEGNAEPEYENEDFFEEEANEEKVFEYLQIKRDYEKIRKSC